MSRFCRLKRQSEQLQQSCFNLGLLIKLTSPELNPPLTLLSKTPLINGLTTFTEGGLNFHEKVELHNLYLNGSLKKFTHSLKLFVNKIKCPSLKQHCLHLLQSKKA